MAKVEKTEEEWKNELDPEKFAICRLGGTERAFTGKYWDTKTPGTYACAACTRPLFDSKTKYDSGSGWPSFYAPIAAEAVCEHEDHKYGMRRVEVTCHDCNSHLGHVFEDGPPPTGLRYCINSASIDLQPAGEESGDVG
jgi:peptide-methionine (R)-S-oxide reductase